MTDQNGGSAGTAGRTRKALKRGTADNLDRYRAKRDFKKTAEPEGQLAAGQSFTYIIQKHEASHLHYDFRLELDGTLKSWAVPKGPSYDPRDKRLAMEVEDHPVGYATFEGIIPKGEYGGGTVMLWDRGKWEPVGDPRAGLSAGKLVFRLKGERLQGEWTLVRFHGKESSRTGSGEQHNERHHWFLMKHRDEFVREGDAGTFTAQNVTSVASGRTMAEIAADRDLVWQDHSAQANVEQVESASGADQIQQANPSERHSLARRSPGAKNGSSALRTSVAAKRESPRATDASGVKPKLKTKAKTVAALPGFIEPQLATLSDAMPKGTEWVHEVKFDGYRMLAYIGNGAAHMISRNNKDWTAVFSVITDCLAMLPVTNAIIDGEVVCINADGKSDFSQLKNALADKITQGLQYYAFDLLYLDGNDVRSLPLTQRKAMLAALIEHIPETVKGRIQFSAEFDDKNGTFFQSVCSMHLEGVISKRADAPYLSGRGKTWLKTKCVKRAEFVIGGFTPPSNGSDGIGALLLGYFDGKTLHYAGRVGTGWNAATSVRLHKALDKLGGAGCPFATIETAARRAAHWVQPRLVCEVQFTEWTPDGHLRHPSFQGLREDKPAREVTRDREMPAAKAVEEAAAQVKDARTPRQPGDETAKHGAAFHNAKPDGRSRKSSRIAEQAAKATEHAAKGTTVDETPASTRSDGSVTVGNVRISHPKRIVFPDAQISKQQLAEYYFTVADMLLPHVVQRPISMLRCPDGIGGKCFFQRHLGLGNSPHLHELSIPVKGADQEYLMIKDAEGLLALIQWGVIEIHPWQCTAKKLDKPDRMIFDLDPDPTVSWKSLIEGALEVRARMTELGLTSFLKTTGGKGLHVVVPMAPVYEWDTIKSFARLIAQSMEEDSPQKYISRMTKAARKGRIFVDYLRNDITATAVAPFSVRARAGATVSTPLAWKELTRDLNVADFNINTVMARIAKRKADPWIGFFELKQKLQKRHLTALDIMSKT